MTESGKSKVTTRGRRGFLLTLGTGGVAALGAAIKPVTEALPAESPTQAPLVTEGYRETDHVREYYRTAKL